MRNNLSRIFFGRTFELILFGVLFVSDTVIRSLFPFSRADFLCNDGGVWGSDIPSRFLIVLSWTLLSVLSVWWFREPDRHVRMLLVLILAGGSGNLLDRMLLGCVRDFRVFQWFPAFNLGDVLLTFGAVLFLVAFSRTKKGLS